MGNNDFRATEVDPDPYAVLSAVLGAASVAYQFVQIHLRGTAATVHQVADDQTEAHLLNLQDTIEAFDKRLDAVLRAIEQGCRNPEEEFYEAKYGFATGFMNLERVHHKRYTDNLHWLATQFGQIANWAGLIIEHNPTLADQLGREILKLTTGAPDKINRLIADGKSNRQVLAEGRLIVSACKQAIERRLKQKN